MSDPSAIRVRPLQFGFRLFCAFEPQQSGVLTTAGTVNSEFDSSTDSMCTCMCDPRGELLEHRDSIGKLTPLLSKRSRR